MDSGELGQWESDDPGNPYFCCDTEIASIDGLGYLECSCGKIQGPRKSQEDYVVGAVAKDEVAHLHSTSSGRIAWFGVFDGHGGSNVAKFVAKNLLYQVVSRLNAMDNNDDVPTRIANSIRAGFKGTEELLAREPVAYSGFFAWIFDISESTDFIGSTAVLSAITASHIIIAHAGDSRAVLVRNGEVKYETEDHVPSNEQEAVRIRKSNRVTLEDGSLIGSEIEMALTVCRGFGDFWWKGDKNLPPESQPVTCEPRIETIERNAHDEFLIIASDGIWGSMSTDEVVDFVHEKLIIERVGTEICAKKLIEYCYDACMSTDNISIVLVDLRNRPSSETKQSSCSHSEDYLSIGWYMEYVAGWKVRHELRQKGR